MTRRALSTTLEGRKMANQPVVDEKLVAYCGLYCGTCKLYLKGRCKGCVERKNAGWCKVRTCCLENKYDTCAACKKFEDIDDCSVFNNFFSKVFFWVFNSNRKANVEKIKLHGKKALAEELSGMGRPSYKRKHKHTHKN
jgi:hypothetical protein